MTLATCLLAPVIIAITWAIPNVLCNPVREDISSDEMGFMSCLHAKLIDWNTQPAAGTGLLMYWLIESFWVAFFPVFCVLTLYGYQVRVG